MSYRIRYEVRKKRLWPWAAMALGAVGLWCMAAGEWLYDAFARYVGGMILGPH